MAEQIRTATGRLAFLRVHSAETGDLFGLALTPSLRDSPLPMGEGLGVRADTPPFFPEYLF